MRVLLIAPQPFYQERGTPIAVNMLLKTLVDRGEQVDLLTYHEGSDVEHGSERIIRSRIPSFIRGVKPGFTWKKVVCDLFLFASATRLLFREDYDLIHAVEESAYMVAVLQWFFRVPYIYDMDSSIPQQIVEKTPGLVRVAGVMEAVERFAVRRAVATVPMCEALAQLATGYGAQHVMVLEDVSMVDDGDGEDGVSNLRDELCLDDSPVLLYVGNLEGYQGAELMLRGFAGALERGAKATLVVIGGVESDILRYRALADDLGVGSRVHFTGPRPVRHLGAYLKQADILVSPRTKGENTPMKIYSYLGSGRAILATDLPTHTQVLDPKVAALSAPKPQKFADAMVRLIGDETLRQSLGAAGRGLAEERFSYAGYSRKVNALYDNLAVVCGCATS